jgi:hypothetical protein
LSPQELPCSLKEPKSKGPPRARSARAFWGGCFAFFGSTPTAVCVAPGFQETQRQFLFELMCPLPGPKEPRNPKRWLAQRAFWARPASGALEAQLQVSSMAAQRPPRMQLIREFHFIEFIFKRWVFFWCGQKPPAFGPLRGSQEIPGGPITFRGPCPLSNAGPQGRGPLPAGPVRGES